MTPARPTSEPVPAVVGTATIGAIPAASARVHQSPTSSKSHTDRVWPTMKAISLPSIERRAAAEGDDAVMPAGLVNAAMPAATLASTGLGCTSENTAVRQPGVARATCSACAGHRQLGEARIGDEQRVLDAGGLAGLARSSLDPPGAEADRGRVIPVGASVGMFVISAIRWLRAGDSIFGRVSVS